MSVSMPTTLQYRIGRQRSQAAQSISAADDAWKYKWIRPPSARVEYVSPRQSRLARGPALHADARGGAKVMVPWCSLECTPACQAGGRGFKSRRDRTTEHGRVAQLAERPPNPAPGRTLCEARRCVVSGLGVENRDKPGPVGPVGDGAVSGSQLVSTEDRGRGDDAISGIGMKTLCTEFYRANGDLIIHRDDAQAVGQQLVPDLSWRLSHFQSPFRLQEGKLPEHKRRNGNRTFLPC